VRAAAGGVEDGAACVRDEDCLSGFCGDSPAGLSSGERYCFAREANCAAGGKPGFYYGDVLTTADRNYICAPHFDSKAQSGWRVARNAGEDCADEFDCVSHLCLPGPPDNRRTYCAAPQKHCGAPGLPGFLRRQVVSTGGRLYRCERSADRGYAWQFYDPIFLIPKNPPRVEARD
jgi:hypothetical protein